MYLKTILTALAVTCMLSGCSTTDDPRKGGLFSYSPEKYEKRLAERGAMLNAYETDAQLQENESAQLKQTKANKQREVANLKKQLNASQRKLDNSLANLKKSSNSQQVQSLQKKSQQLKQQSAKVDSISDLEAKKAEINRLQRELKELELEADALSRL